MKFSPKILSIVLFLVLLIGGSFYFLIPFLSGPGKYDAFAQCLKDKGVKFYGAFWCPHCQNQKNEFGSSSQFLPYIECSNPDGKSQTQLCIDQNIDSYPTWEFSDGSRVNGEKSFSALSEKSGCPLPIITE